MQHGVRYAGNVGIYRCKGLKMERRTPEARNDGCRCLVWSVQSVIIKSDIRRGAYAPSYPGDKHAKTKRDRQRRNRHHVYRLQFPDLAVQQLEHAIKTLHMCGVAVGASVAGDEFSDPKFHPFWAKCEELGILIFIHPQSTPDLAPRLKGNGWLANTIGNPLDTTIALSHLIFEGTLDRFPGLKICSAHGGGFLPSYAPRSDNSLCVAPDMDTGVKLKKKPTEYLRTMYYDTLVFTSEALRHLAAEVGSSQLVIGTDHPIPWQDKSVDHILNAPGFTDEERRAMLGETAAKLLGIKP